MKRTEVFKTMTVKKQMSSFYRDGILLILCIIAMILGYFFQTEIGLGLFITTSVLSCLFLILTIIAISPVIKELSISKTYSIYTGRVVEVHENNMLKSVYLTIEYESPLVTRKDTHACFYPMDGKILFGKKIRIGVSQKSNKAIVLP